MTMQTVMLQYAQPHAARLRCQARRGGASVVADAATDAQLWRRAAVSVPVLSAIATVGFIGLMMIWRLDGEVSAGAQFGRAASRFPMIAATLLWLGLSAWLALRAFAAGGVVTSIELNGASLTCTVQTLLGLRARRSPAKRITRIDVEAAGDKRVLRVSRRGRLRIRAFGDYPADSVEEAARVLKNAWREQAELWARQQRTAGAW